MSNRRLEVFHYRQVLYQMQQGMSDRAIALGGTMGRRKAAQLRCKAATEGWLTPGASLPEALQGSGLAYATSLKV